MARLRYLLDTNVIADYLKQWEPTTSRLHEAIKNGHTIYLCEPVKYEVLRGLLKVNATRKLQIFEQILVPQLSPLILIPADWHQAAVLWAKNRTIGRQLSDIDTLIAALAQRTGSIVVTHDNDFDVFAIPRENWHSST